MRKEELNQLARKYILGTATPEEEEALHQWYNLEGNDRQIIHIDDTEENLNERLLAKVRARIKPPKKRSPVWRYAAAALLLLSLGFFYRMYQKMNTGSRHYYTRILKNDVGPGGNYAVLKSPDGQTLNLESLALGSEKTFGNLEVLKTAEGQVVFSIADTRPALSENQYQTIITPRGGEFLVQLPDGSKVWLNAASSLVFPTVFSEKSREVSLTGEGYFEIVKQYDSEKKRIPFYVNTPNQQVQVVGTQFNINAYEAETRTTLVSGKVIVAGKLRNIQQALQPGEQSRLTQHGNITVAEANMTEALAWRNGDFVFSRENLPAIMRQLERWYDVEPVYEENFDELTFSGALSRKKNISAVLNMLQLTGKVKFKIEGRKVYVNR